MHVHMAFARPRNAASPRCVRAGCVCMQGAAREVAPLGLQAKPLLLSLAGGVLQHVADALDTAAPGSTLDLQGGTYAGPLQHPQMKIGVRCVPSMYASCSRLDLDLAAEVHMFRALPCMLCCTGAFVWQSLGRGAF